MATAAQSIAKQSSPLEWFIHFVKQELAPYPGRTEIVARTVIAATLVMIVCETLRVPFAWQGAIYAFLVSRESPSATLRSATTIFLVTVVSAACFLLSASLVINLAWLHFLWVIGSFFLGFYAVSIFSDYIVAVVFVNMISAEIPLWDHHVPAEFNVERTIWLCFATLIAIAITMGVEIAFSRFKPGDEIIAGVAERLTAIQTMLASYAENNSVDQATEADVVRLSVVGTSILRRALRRSSHSPHYAEQVAGGFLIGMGSQMFILPYLDSIAGFTILFILVTALASWFATSSPRLSYFGIQMALAFYLINLEEFAMQTSLAVARDRVVGILLGLTMMWIVFDQLWGASGVLQMRGAFVSTVRLLAQFAKEPLSPEPQAAIERSYSLREQINQGFDRVRALADGVLFEFGPSRNQGLLWRGKIREWQPQLRLLFITEIALWKYRAGLPGFELPPAIAAAQRGFDDELARALEAIADRIEGRPSQVGHFEEPFSRLERSVSGYEGYEGSEPQSETADRFQALLSLQHRIESLATSLQKGI